MGKLTSQQRVYVETTVNEVEVLKQEESGTWFVRLGLKQQGGKLNWTTETDPDDFSAPLDESLGLRRRRLRNLLQKLGAWYVWNDTGLPAEANPEEKIVRYLCAAFKTPSEAREAAMALRTECRLKNDKSHLPPGEERVKITKKTMLMAAVAVAVVVVALIIMNN